MGSLYLNALNKEAKAALQRQLWESQSGKCFISGKPIDLALDEVDIDHIVPTRDNGPDNPSNFALTLSHYNRSKQAADLRVARVLARFEEIKAEADSDDRGANLNDVLKAYGGGKEPLRAKLEGDAITYVVDGAEKFIVPTYTDKMSGTRYFFAVLPVQVIFHDDRINPRPLGANLRGLVEEFHKWRPQLHVALAWMNSTELPNAKINVFDGQHKAAAQLLLGATTLAVRVFIDPNFDVLLTTNTNAGTTLRQVAFDKAVQRRLGSSMLRDRIERYRRDKGLNDDFEGFSERDLVEYFKGEQRSVTRYVLDGIRDAITYSSENKLRDYIETAGRGTEKPFSYSAIEKTFYSKFIGQKMLETPLNYKDDVGENPRDVEIKQVCRLMSMIADKIYIGKYDEEIGTRRIENKIQDGEDVPEIHLRAFRMAKEEILYAWLNYVSQLIENSFMMSGRTFNRERLFQYIFPEQLWVNIGTFIDNLARLKMWIDRDASVTIFGGKQTYSFWEAIFESGTSPKGQKVMPMGLNIIKMIES
jgi:hypothetical protein